MNKRVGITGARGYIGRALMQYPNTFAIDADVKDVESLKMEIESMQPDLIVHLAAITNPDVCEDVKNRTSVSQTNLRGTFHVGSVCTDLGIGMVYMSTFHVFNGKKWFQDSYTEKDTPDPINFYGLSKLTGESYHQVYDNMKIIRAPHVYDYGRLSSHIEMLDRQNVEYPKFLKRSFMHLDHFIESLVYYIDCFHRMPPVLNISTNDTVSWYDFMNEVSKALMLDFSALPRTKEDGNFRTPRPHKAGLNPSLSYSLGFPHYSIMDGIALLREGK